MTATPDPVVVRRRRTTGPGKVNATIAAAITLLVAVLALNTAQAPPPAIAELSPQPQKQITEAPQEQSSQFGRGADGGAGDGGSADTTVPPTTVPPPVVERARVRRCVGNPPRQIEDPQSPPCVAYWEGGDNGGTTTKGVTADEIRVAIRAPGGPGAIDGARVQAAFEGFFNKRFEFYGRKLTLVPWTPSGDNTTIENMLADAARADEELGVFAVLSYSEQLGREYHFYDELARRGVISVQASYTGISNSGEDKYRQYAPYQWNYMPTADRILETYQAFICRSLAGRPPKWAGAPQVSAPVRRFGILRRVYADGSQPLAIDAYVAGLRRCGVEPVVADYSEAGNAGGPVVRFAQEGVTTAQCLCPTGDLATFIMNSATTQGWFPEWLISNYLHQDDDFAANAYPREHSPHAFGLMSWNKPLPLDQHPFWWAIKEMDPSYSSEPALAVGSFDYWNLLLLASGIQMAGPRLTPASFAAALGRTTFPNPGAGAAPYYQGRVGFPSVHSMVQDFAPVWWNPNAQSLMFRRSAGAYCFVDRGRRYDAATWPEGELAFFTGDCR